MTTQYPRHDGTPLPEWSAIRQDVREHLAQQAPHRLQRIMYRTHVGDVPPAEFAAHISEADRKLRELLATDPNAVQYFGVWTFASVADEPDPMRAAEAEYYFCDALIEYGNRYYAGGPWGVPVLDPSLYGLYEDPS